MRAFSGASQLMDALSGCDVVIIPAGVPRKPGMTVRHALACFPLRPCHLAAATARRSVQHQCRHCQGRVQGMALTAARLRSTFSLASDPQAISSACPRAIVNIISNPVNSTVPIAAEVFKQAGVYDSRRLFGAFLQLFKAYMRSLIPCATGVTHLDVMRARAFVAEAMGVPPEGVDVPVIGGHAGETILPILSQTTPPFAFTEAEAEALTVRIQNAGTEARHKANAHVFASRLRNRCRCRLSRQKLVLAARH